MLSWKISFVKPSGSLIFLSAPSGPQNTGARGRLLLMLVSGENYFSNDTVHRAKGKTSWPAICLNLDQAHSELQLPAAWCHGGKCAGAEAWGAARRMAIDFSLREFSRDAVIVVSFPRLYLSALSSPVIAVSPNAFLSPGPPAGLESGGVNSQ